jgi:voltage-gated potassium channel
VPSTEPTHLNARVQRWRARTGAALTIIAIGSLPLLALEFVRSDLTATDRDVLDVIDVIVFAAFTIDYVVQLWLADHRRRFVGAERLALLLVVSQALAMFPVFTVLALLRTLRAARIARLVAISWRIIATGDLASRRGRDFFREHSLRLALSVAGITWISAAVAFTIVEDVAGDDHQSFGDGLWWSLTTMTSVGYGDITPTTVAGRIVGGVAMVAGVSVFAVVTGSVAALLLGPPAAAAAEDGGTIDPTTDSVPSTGMLEQ